MDKELIHSCSFAIDKELIIKHIIFFRKSKQTKMTDIGSGTTFFYAPLIKQDCFGLRSRNCSFIKNNQIQGELSQEKRWGGGGS
jgi:hypothetical protein